jgi:hypothetical protein
MSQHPHTPMTSPRRTLVLMGRRRQTGMALIALMAAAAGGLVWGPGRGIGTDDKVRDIAAPVQTPWNPEWRERLAPASDREERLRFGVLGGVGLVALLLLLVRQRRSGGTP